MCLYNFIIYGLMHAAHLIWAASFTVVLGWTIIGSQLACVQLRLGLGTLGFARKLGVF